MVDPITPFVAPACQLLHSAKKAVSPTKHIEKSSMKLNQTTETYGKYEDYYHPEQKEMFWQQMSQYNTENAGLRHSAEDAGVLGSLKTLMDAREHSKKVKNFYQEVLSNSRELEARAKIEEARLEAKGRSEVQGLTQNNGSNESATAFEENTSRPAVNDSEHDIDKFAAVESNGRTADKGKTPLTEPHPPRHTQAQPISTTGKKARGNHRAASTGDRSGIGSSVINPTASLPSGTSAVSSGVSQNPMTKRYGGEERQTKKQRAPAPSHPQQSVTVHATNRHKKARHSSSATNNPTCSKCEFPTDEQGVRYATRDDYLTPIIFDILFCDVRTMRHNFEPGQDPNLATIDKKGCTGMRPAIDYSPDNVHEWQMTCLKYNTSLCLALQTLGSFVPLDLIHLPKETNFLPSWLNLICITTVHLSDRSFTFPRVPHFLVPYTPRNLAYTCRRTPLQVLPMQICTAAHRRTLARAHIRVAALLCTLHTYARPRTCTHRRTVPEHPHTLRRLKLCINRGGPAGLNLGCREVFRALDLTYDKTGGLDMQGPKLSGKLNRRNSYASFGQQNGFALCVRLSMRLNEIHIFLFGSNSRADESAFRLGFTGA
ncbi:hypothetical protein BU17DRAFT_64814 [Hysterangium stoloniferum]|nr:hypothetical protein BU17DRAFT_64814 [Hysterangium stoloniferum]